MSNEGETSSSARQSAHESRTRELAWLGISYAPPVQPGENWRDALGIIGAAPSMLRLCETIELIGPTNATVLLVGETGTGKDLIARALHAQSPRRKRPLVVIDCGAIAESLLESELFGHLKGAFTGAVNARIGLFEYANEGTVFLDEIEVMSLALQAKILRVIECGEIRIVGANETRRVDIRIIGATNRDMSARMRRGEFREDLYYRLNVCKLDVPALRDRKEDIPQLVDAFIPKFNREHGRKITRISAEALMLLQQHSWPGNVRELENCIEQSVIMAEGNTIQSKDLPHVIPQAHNQQSESGAECARSFISLDEEMSALEAKRIRQALEASQGNESEAARKLGIDRNRIIRFKKRNGLQ